MKVVKEEIPVDETEEPAPKDEEEDDKEKSADDEEVVEDTGEDKEKPKTKTIEKTVWDWELLNDNKPIWTRK